MRPHAVKKTITFHSYRNVDNNSIVNDIKHILNILDVSSLTAEDCTIWYNNFFNSLGYKFCPLISKEILVKADARMIILLQYCVGSVGGQKGGGAD